MRFTATTAPEAAEWQKAARQRLFHLMMGGSVPSRVPLDVRVLQSVEDRRGGYTLDEITYQSLPGRRAHAWVTIPLDRTTRARPLLALHGHNGTGEQTVKGLGLYWYGKAMAEMGYAVIAPDIGSHDLQQPGWSLMGERTWDAIRAIDCLLERPEVDASKGVAVAGLSLGGETTMYVAALDARVSVADCSGWLTTVENMQTGHCPCWEFPGLVETFDFSDIYAMYAPRPLVFEIGLQERAPGGFPVDVARKALAEVQRAYHVFGAEDQAVLDIHEGGHIFVGRRLWQPLREALGVPPPWLQLQGEAELLRRGEIARRSFARALAVVDGWWAIRDRQSGLYPRTTDQPVWAPPDNAADMLPFLYITCQYLSPERKKQIHQAFDSEKALTSRVGVLRDWYNLKTNAFLHPEPDMRRLIFGAAEYCKDGLLPMTEVMGPGPWLDRMKDLVDAIFEHCSVQSEYGLLPASDTEVNGEILQVLARLFHITGDQKYLQHAIRIGNAYCLEVLPRCGLPAFRWDFTKHEAVDSLLSLNDHCNEIVGGLSELLVAEKAAGSPEYEAHSKAISAMMHRLLEVGRNKDGIWFNHIDACSGKLRDAVPPDPWGYALNGVVTTAMLTGSTEGHLALRKALQNIDKPDYWYWSGADSFADSIESGLVLMNRFPEGRVWDWMQTVMPLFLAYQKESGIVEGWYGDGNSARTELMAALYCTQGTYCRPWRDDLRFGAQTKAGRLWLALTSEKPWSGKIIFDTPRHREHMRLPLNYPRLNEFPEWYVVERGRDYDVTVGGRTIRLKGEALAQGVEVSAVPGKVTRVEVRPAR